MALMKLTLVAKKAFDAYLMVSAVAGSVTTKGALIELKMAVTRIAARSVFAAYDDPLRVEKIMYRRTLSQELRIGDYKNVIST